MTTISVCFTNFGPYHLARLRALADRLGAIGRPPARLSRSPTRSGAIPGSRADGSEPFEWITLFPGRALEIDRRATSAPEAMTAALDRDRPDALGIVGYARPESMAALAWASEARPADDPDVGEPGDRPPPGLVEGSDQAADGSRGSRAALVGGPRHRDYLVKLGMAARQDRPGLQRGRQRRLRQPGRGRPTVATTAAEGFPIAPTSWRSTGSSPRRTWSGWSGAFARYRADAPTGHAWDLVLCGDGPGAARSTRRSEPAASPRPIHRPGSSRPTRLAPWLAHASAFVHPSLMEPWGLVVNEAAACGLPLLVSDRAGCVETLVPDPPGTTGRRFDPRDEDELTAALAWMAGLPESERRAMGRRAAEVVGRWGPERFARGTIEALELAGRRRSTPARRRRPIRETDRSPIMSGLVRAEAGRPADAPTASRPAGCTAATGSTPGATAGWSRASWG